MYKSHDNSIGLPVAAAIVSAFFALGIFAGISFAAAQADGGAPSRITAALEGSGGINHR